MKIAKSLEKNFTFRQINRSALGNDKSRGFVMVFLAKNLALTGVRGVKAVSPHTSLPLFKCD